MLHLLIGRDRKQNTQALIEKIAAQVKARREGQILIVPEQFSHDAERALCAACGDTASLYAEVLSFTRLADRAAAVCGGVARAALDAGGRFTAITLALEHALPRLKLYAVARTKPELIVQLSAQIEEFKNYRVSPKELRAAGALFTGAFAQKLEELALILESYDAVCAAGRADPSDKLEQLCERLWETDFASGKTFYFDGFTDFTAQQTAILAVLLRLGCEVTAAFVCDDVRHGSTVYDAARESAAWLLRTASEYGAAHEVTVLPRSGNLFLQDHLFAHDRAVSEETARIAFGSAVSPAEECELAVREVRALLMAGYRCGEIAIACTSRETYRALLRPMLERCGIPAYWSGRDDILRESTLRGLLAALRAITGGMEAEDVFSFLHSPIGVLEREECDRLQNYVFTWRIRGTLWQKEFTMHPGGYGKPMEEQDKAALRSLNASRAALMQPLLNLKNGLEQAKQTAEQVTALYRFMEEICMRERLDALVEQRTAADQRAQELSQVYDICIRAMEQLWLVLGETVRTPEDFAAMLRQLLQQYELGTIPARLDCVTVGDLASLRHRQLRAVLVLGAGDGQLPQIAPDSGILSDQERRLLENRTELTLAPDRTGQMDRELSVIYDVLCGAQDYLYVSCSGDTPSYLLRRLMMLYPNAAHKRAELPLLAGDADAGAYLAACGKEDPLGAQLASLGRAELLAAAEETAARADYRLGTMDREAVEALYQSVIQLSASKIDLFSSCKCAYFLQYGLRAKEQKEAAVDAPIFGTFVHSVLEETARRVMEEGGFAAVSQARQQEITGEEIAKFTVEQIGDPDEQEPRMQYLFNRNLEEVREVAAAVGEELRISDFEPRAFELAFKPGGTLPPIEVQGRNGTARVIGYIDRTDIWSAPEADYIRVVDYKTGVKKFSYVDVLNGMGLQMLLYLFALRRSGTSLWGREVRPAGVMYVPARAPIVSMKERPSDEGAVLAREEEVRRSGLLLDDERILEAMEHTGGANTRYLPCKHDRKGELSGHLASNEQLKLLERHVERTLAAITDDIFCGAVHPNPYFRGREHSSCRYCSFAAVCHLDSCEPDKRYFAAKKESEFWRILEERDHG